jgi:hypothetical protein
MIGYRCGQYLFCCSIYVRQLDHEREEGSPWHDV